MAKNVLNLKLVLDRSGSMTNQWSDAVGGVSAYIEGLPVNSDIELLVFDYEFISAYKGKASKFSSEILNDYKPRGGTALYDAAGEAMFQLLKVGAKRSALVVMTDGEENSSKKYKFDTIRILLDLFEQKEWEVLFLGAELKDVERIAGGLGIAMNKSLLMDSHNYVDAFRGLAASTAQYSTVGTRIDITNEKKEAAVKVK